MPRKKPPAGKMGLSARTLGRPTGRTGEDTRRRICQAAASLFSLHGLSSVSMSDIAGAAGLTGPAIYNYFPSKDSLFNEIVCSLYEEIRQAYTEVLDRTTSMSEALESILDVNLELYREDAVLQRLSSTAALEYSRDHDRFRDIGDAEAEIGKVFTALVERGVALGELPAHTDIWATGPLLACIYVFAPSIRTLSDPSIGSFRRTVASLRELVRVTWPPTNVRKETRPAPAARRRRGESKHRA
jgi:AcrR family transcriptional regulator